MKFANIDSTLRLRHWWIPIVPPVLLFAYMAVLYSGQPFSETVDGFIVLAISTIGTAASGFIINDWSDIKIDASCGKKNGMAPLKPLVRILLLLTSFSVSFIPLLLLKNLFAIQLYILQIVLFVIYSCFPFRLKRFPIPAILLDSLYSGTIFWLLAFTLWTFDPVPAIIVAFTGIMKGLRNIIYHQYSEIEADKKLPFKTFVTSHREKFVEQILNVIFIAEVATLFSWYFISLEIGILITSGILLWMLFLIFKKIRILHGDSNFPFFKTDIIESVKFNSLYEELLPVLIIVFLCYQDLNYLILLAVHVLLFGKFEVLKKLFHVFIIHFLYHKVLVYLYYKLFCNQYIKLLYRFLGFKGSDGK